MERLVRMKRNKFNAKPVIFRGQKFASKREAARWQELLLLERAGQIKGLVAHPIYMLVVEGQPIGKYTPDSSYMEHGKYVVEDVKSPATAKLADYRLRTKLFRALYRDIDFREVF